MSSTPYLPRIPVLLALAAGGCNACVAGETPAGPAIDVERTTLTLDQNGLSGLTSLGHRTWVAVAERDAMLVEIHEHTVTRVTPIEGVDPSLDLESITWLGGERFAIGTESEDAARSADVILVVERGADRATVVKRVSMPYLALGAVAGDNDGIEGLCRAGDTWLAAVEHVVEEGDARFAPLGLRDVNRRRSRRAPRDSLTRGEGAEPPPANDAWRGHRLRLTTAIGKISALDCRDIDGAIEVVAIERGIDRALLGTTWVARVLRFTVDPGGDGDLAIEPEVVADLSGRLADQPNPEGIALDGDGYVITIDNHYRVRTGPNELLEVRPTTP